MINDTAKTCNVCNEAKPLEEFSRDKAMKSGYTNRCLICTRRLRREAWAARRGPKKPREAFAPRACTKCGEVKDRWGFYRSDQFKDGYERRCKACRTRQSYEAERKRIVREGGLSEKTKARSRRYYAEKRKSQDFDHEAYRANIRRLKYGITTEQFDQMMIDCDGKCSICREDLERPCIDHDHACCPSSKKSCGKCVRGLLCPTCNLALGYMRDDPSRLIEAAKYLNAWTGRSLPE